MSFVFLFFTVIGLVFITGLCIGSFLNVVVLRAFSNESIAYPPSKCPKCQTPLKWYHNIPLLSYIMLHGKCAYCKEKISIQYPIVELFTGLFFIVIFLKYSIDLNTLFVCAFASLFIVIATTDIIDKVVFDFHTYSLIILGLIYNFFNLGHLYIGEKIFHIGHFAFGINHSFIISVIGLFVGVLIMEGLSRLGILLAGSRAFGEGDSYIAAGLGAIFGLKYLLPILVYSFVIQLILTIPVYFKKLYKIRDYKTLIALVIFFTLTAVYKSLLDTDFLHSTYVMLGYMLLLSAVGFYASRRILTGVKNQDNLTYLPFGPAMVICALVTIIIM